MKEKEWTRTRVKDLGLSYKKLGKDIAELMASFDRILNRKKK